MTRWRPRLELARLLEGLSEEILAATDEEVRQMHGRSIAGTAGDVRRLINAARSNSDEGLRVELGDALREPEAAPQPAGLRRPSHQQRH